MTEFEQLVSASDRLAPGSGSVGEYLFAGLAALPYAPLNLLLGDGYQLDGERRRLLLAAQLAEQRKEGL
ncbi:MAG TPA: hypothetical protein VF723_11310 [Pyrinomonadaceae bacterium]